LVNGQAESGTDFRLPADPASLFRRRLDLLNFRKTGAKKRFLWVPHVQNVTMIVYKIITKLPFFLIAGFIWFLSSQSILPQIKGILGFDKLQHLFAYLVLAGSLGLWFSSNQWQSHRLRTYLLTILITSAYGVVDEIHQYFVPGRDCNVWDWMADTLGAALGALIIMLAGSRLLSKIKCQ
jgi:VanZ family protein